MLNLAGDLISGDPAAASDDDDDDDDIDGDTNGDGCCGGCGCGGHGMPVEVCPIVFASTFLTSSAVISPKFLFLRAEFHLFFTAFGGLPLPRAFAISVHLFPYAMWYLTMSSSSSLVHASLRTSGAKWLKYLSLHCFPTRKGMCLAILDHF